MPITNRFKVVDDKGRVLRTFEGGIDDFSDTSRQAENFADDYNEENKNGTSRAHVITQVRGNNPLTRSTNVLGTEQNDLPQGFSRKTLPEKTAQTRQGSATKTRLRENQGQSDKLTSDNLQVTGRGGKDVFAKHGFMGMINTKTMFTVGEGGKKEFVNRKKVNVFDVDMFSNKKSKKKANNNIFDVGFKF